MKLRQELTPPMLDEQLVTRLAELADELDGNPSEALRAELGRIGEVGPPLRVWPTSLLLIRTSCSTIYGAEVSPSLISSHR
jgi:hypothetical protein